MNYESLLKSLDEELGATSGSASSLGAIPTGGSNRRRIVKKNEDLVEGNDLGKDGEFSRIVLQLLHNANIFHIAHLQTKDLPMHSFLGDGDSEDFVNVYQCLQDWADTLCETGMGAGLIFDPQLVYEDSPESYAYVNRNDMDGDFLAQLLSDILEMVQFNRRFFESSELSADLDNIEQGLSKLIYKAKQLNLITTTSITDVKESKKKKNEDEEYPQLSYNSDKDRYEYPLTEKQIDYWKDSLQEYYDTVFVDEEEKVLYSDSMPDIDSALLELDTEENGYEGRRNEDDASDRVDDQLGTDSATNPEDIIDPSQATTDPNAIPDQNQTDIDPNLEQDNGADATADAVDGLIGESHKTKKLPSFIAEESFPLAKK